jgi:hypothetical protein
MFADRWPCADHFADPISGGMRKEVPRMKVGNLENK